MGAPHGRASWWPVRTPTKHFRAVRRVSLNAWHAVISRPRGFCRALVVLLVGLVACSPAHRTVRAASHSPALGATSTTAPAAFDVPWANLPARQLAPFVEAQPGTNASPCTADHISASIGSSEPAGSASLVTGVNLTNRGAAPCLIGGFPTLVAATGPGLPTVIGDHTRFTRDLSPGDIAPRQSGMLVVYSPRCGDNGTPTTGPLRIYRRLVITLPGGGQTVARTALDLSCGGFSVDPIGVRPKPFHAWYSLLKINVTVPATVRAGTILTYVVALSSFTTSATHIDRCPVYFESIKGNGVQVVKTYRLNCDHRPEIPANGAIRYQMRIPIPAHAPAGILTLAWSIAGPEAPIGGAKLAVVRASRAAVTTTTLRRATSASIATSTSTATPRLRPLFLGHGIGVVEGPGSGGCSDVFVSTDFSHWRDVTPHMSSSPRVQECPYWNSASFVSPQDGWVLGRGGGATDTVLFHTVDAGHTWKQQPGGTTRSNAGYEVVGFANPQVGWRQQFAIGANRPYTLEMTSDAGTTWSAIGPVIEHGGCEQAPVVFTNSRVGIAAYPLTYDYPFGDFAPTPWVWRTVDGGTTWKHLTVPSPPALTAGAALYGSPSFFANIGVLPVAFVHGSRTVVGFYQSHDGGLTWSRRAVTPTQSALFPTTGGDGFCANPTHVAGSFPVVAIAAPNTWWVIGTSHTGSRTISVTRDGGRSWRTVSPIGLPPYTPTIQEYASLEGFISSLRALSDTRAWITVTEGATIGSQSDVLLQTGDGGRTWSRVNLGARR